MDILIAMCQMWYNGRVGHLFGKSHQHTLTNVVWLRLIVGCSWSVLNLTPSRHKKRGGCILSPIWKDKSHNILTLISLASQLPNQYNSTYRLHFHFVEYRLSIHNKNPDHMTTHIRELRMFVHIQKQWKIPWEKLFILWWSS